MFFQNSGIFLPSLRRHRLCEHAPKNPIARTAAARLLPTPGQPTTCRNLIPISNISTGAQPPARETHSPSILLGVAGAPVGRQTCKGAIPVLPAMFEKSKPGVPSLPFDKLRASRFGLAKAHFSASLQSPRLPPIVNRIAFGRRYDRL